jgi:hypothetical protein
MDREPFRENGPALAFAGSNQRIIVTDVSVLGRRRSDRGS